MEVAGTLPRKPLITAVVLVLCLSGCADGEDAPSIEQSTQEEQGTRTGPVAFEVIGHVEGDGAIRATFTPTGDVCTMLLAANHERSNEAPALWFEVLVDGAWAGGINGDSRSIDARADVGDVETGYVVEQAMKAVDQVYGDLNGYPDPFTSWIGFPDRDWSGRTIQATIQANGGLLDNGTQETLGGSVRIAVACNGPIEVTGAWEDDEALLVTGASMDGDIDVIVDPFLVERHVGSLQHQTTGNETSIIVTTGGNSKGSLAINGPIEETIDWNNIPTQPFSDFQTQELRGPSGVFNFTWDQTTAGFGELAFSVWSWAPHDWSATGTPAWPWE